MEVDVVEVMLLSLPYVLAVKLLCSAGLGGPAAERGGT